MSTRDSGSITRLLMAASEGDAGAKDRLWSAVYDELRRLARARRVSEGHLHGHGSSSLVNEAYLRLVGGAAVQWQDRRHFFAAAARAIRRIQIDAARYRNRVKRGGGRVSEPIADQAAARDVPLEDLVALDDALDQLESSYPRCYEIVTLRYYSGLSVEQTAVELGVSPRTVEAEWRFARAWLHRRLNDGADDTQS